MEITLTLSDELYRLVASLALKTHREIGDLLTDEIRKSISSSMNISESGADNRLSVINEDDSLPSFADIQKIRGIISESYSSLGFNIIQNATGRQARERMLRDGLRTEDNLASQGILEARDE